MSAALARLVLETLRLAPAGGSADLAARWSGPDVAARAEAIGVWAAWEGGEQWLLRRLAETGALAGAPPALVNSLRQATREHAAAGMAVDDETARVVRELASLGVAAVLLKGPARRAAVALYPMGAARRTSDVDVLVPTADAERAWRRLAALGYTPVYPFDPARAMPGESELWGPSRHHLRPIRRPGGAAVELHVSTSWELPPATAWARHSGSGTTEVPWQGLSVRVPSATELLWHGLTHAKPSEPGAWVLRFWLDAASLLAAPAVDWMTIAQRLGGAELPDRERAERWLAAAAQLAGVTLPTALAPRRPDPLLRLMAWRLTVFARAGMNASWRSKLLDEATRAELGVGVAPLIGGRSWPIVLRRRTASVSARLLYGAWRAATR